MTAPIWEFRSTVPGATWPAIPSQEAANLLALQFQLERTQWLSPEKLREQQFRQLDSLVRHAYGTVPYYRERWSGLYDPGIRLTPESFSRLPLLTRGALQANFDALKSTSVPAAHGRVIESRTSGSTGTPVRVLKTALVELLWQAILLREHLWFERDLGGKLASIRHGAIEGEDDGWGPATAAIVGTGRSTTLPIKSDVDTQLQWLESQRPDYLLTYPSNLAELVRRSLTRSIRLPTLREVRTFGEMLPPETREFCQRTWGVPVTDAYSSQEVGYMALQCPHHEHYHVQSECVLMEALNGEGGVCAPGATGRVVVTPLHNFAMPLVRYDIGDYAEVGVPCDCRRGLPVLRRVVGRVRNMLVLADGARYWPGLNLGSLAGGAPVLQHQLVQKSFNTIEVRLVTARPLTLEEEQRMRQHLLARLPVPFEIKFNYCSVIDRSAGGKFEEFMSEVTVTG